MNASQRNRSMTRRRFLVNAGAVTTAAAMLPLMQACAPVGQTGGASAPAASGADADIVFAQFQAVPSLDVTQSGGGLSAHEVYRHIYDGLFMFDEAMNPLPVLVESWENSDDFLEWTFHLKPDVKFHDGAPLTASAVKEHFDYMNASSSLLRFMTTIEAVDDLTLRITTEEPFAPFLNYLAHAFAGPMNPALVTEHGDNYSQYASGTGPYKLEEFVPNERTVLVRNEEYHGERPKLDRITFVAIPEDGARSNMLETGEADVIIPVPANSIERLSGDSNLEIIAKPILTCQYVGMNLTRAPLDDQLVRKAFNHAVDKELIVEALQSGYAHVADSPVAATAQGYTPVMTYEYDPERAKALLEEAGWVDSDGDGIREKDGQTLTLNLWTPVGLYPKDTQLAETIQASLREIGADIQLQQVESGNWFTSLRVPLDQANYDLFLWSLTPTTGDANQALTELFRSDEDPAAAPLRWNLTRFSDPEIDELIDNAAGTIDAEERARYMQEVQERMMDFANYIYLYYHDHVAGARTHMQNVRIIPNRLVDLREASVEG